MEKTLMAAMNEHLRLKSDDSSHWLAQIKALTPQDKQDLKAEFEKPPYSYTIVTK